MSKSQPQAEDGKEFVPTWDQIVGLKKTKIRDVALEIWRLNDEKKAIEKSIAELKDAGLALLIKADVKTVLVDGARVTAKDTTSVRQDKKKLYALAAKKGLADWVMEILEKSKVRTRGQTLLITPPKADGEDGGNGNGDDE